MKKITLLAALLIAAVYTNAQVFWTENWTGTTCSQGCTTYTGPNGSWTTATIGRNGAAANEWFYSYQEQGLGRGSCGTGTGTSASAHVGSVSTSPILSLLCTTGDCGAVNDDGSGAPSTYTSSMIQSPIINCTGKSGITLSFNYIYQGAPGHDSATIWYYNGTAWALLNKPAATNNTSCSGQGLWTHYTITLPASANNNSKVQVGFKWWNDTLQTADNASGADWPSFAVDSIQLSTKPTGVNELYNNVSVSVYPNPSNGVFNLAINNLELGMECGIQVYDMIGRQVYSHPFKIQNSEFNINLSNRPAGIYFYRIIDESGNLVKEGKLVIQ